MPGTPLPQIRRIAFDQQEIGMGFNSDTGQVVGTALEFDAPAPAAGQEASATATIVTTHESLMESLNFSFEAEGRYGFSSVGVKADFAKSTTYNSVSTFVVARMVVQNQIIRGRNFRISQHAQDVLDREPFEVFTRAFGDSFVRGRLTGGEFYAVMRITSLETGLQTSLGVTLQAEINGGVAGGSFKGSLNTAMRDTRTKTEFNVTFYQRGGSGREEIGTTLSVDEIKDRLQSFPSAVANNPFPYQVELATYDTIPLDVPPKEQEELLLQTLADADKRKLEFIQQRNDFEFAAEHQEYFVDPPSPADCLAHAATYLRATNAVIAHLIGLSNGEIRPPQFFDPGALDPPIVFPAVQLRKKSIDDRAFRDWYLVRDDPSITQDDHMLVNAIANLAKERINDFDHIPEADRGAALEAVVTGFEEGRLSQIDVFENDQIVKLKSVEHLGGMLPSGITKLALQRNNLRSLKGIERFSKLTELTVAGNERIDQLNEIGALPALRELRFEDNRVSDVTPLLACTELEMVSLGRNDVVDLTPLTQLTKLNTLLVEASLVGVPNPEFAQTFNPATHAAGLEGIPALANPFLLGRTLDVRLGKLSEGPDAQLTGRATRVGDSLRFDVALSRGNDTIQDTWHLIQVNSSPGVSAIGPEGSQLVVVHVQSLGFAVFSFSLAADRPNAIVDRTPDNTELTIDAVLVDRL